MKKLFGILIWFGTFCHVFISTFGLQWGPSDKANIYFSNFFTKMISHINIFDILSVLIGAWLIFPIFFKRKEVELLDTDTEPQTKQ